MFCTRIVFAKIEDKLYVDKFKGNISWFYANNHFPQYLSNSVSTILNLSIL